MRKIYYSQGSYPGMFEAKDKAAAVRNQNTTRGRPQARPRSASQFFFWRRDFTLC
jgi:hypothetical protein